MRPVISPKYRWLALALAAGLSSCADGGPEQGSEEVTLADCGGTLGELLEKDTRVVPGFDATYSDALAAWSFKGDSCGLGVFAGTCADGKRLLYRNGGFTSEIRYYDGEQLVGYVGSGDIAICPSICPSSRFYGDAGNVRCDSPLLEELCAGSSRFLGGGGLWMPFADGEAPGGCN